MDIIAENKQLFGELEGDITMLQAKIAVKAKANKATVFHLIRRENRCFDDLKPRSEFRRVARATNRILKDLKTKKEAGEELKL